MADLFPGFNLNEPVPENDDGNVGFDLNEPEDDNGNTRSISTSLKMTTTMLGFISMSLRWSMAMAMHHFIVSLEYEQISFVSHFVVSFFNRI